MSNNEEGIDLELSLGSTNYRAETSLKEDDNNLDAGANAATSWIDDMAFASSDDPLSELVWSPRSGLSLKCADSSMPDHRPFLPWNVRPTINEIEDDKVADETKLIISSYERHNMDELCGSGNEVDNLADRTDESKADVATNWNNNASNNASMSNVVIRAIPIRSEPDKKFSHLLIRSMQSRQVSDDEVTSASEKVNKNKTVVPNPNYPGPVLNPCAEPSLLYQEKGKEKAMSGRGSSDDGAESCNSAGLFLKGVKRHRDDEIENKMTKKQIQGSSFMNWISNVVKGRPEFNRIGGSSSSHDLALARPDNACDNKSPKKGFHTIFQSSHYPNAKDGVSIEESKLSDKQIVKSNKEEIAGPSDFSREQANITSNNNNNNNNTSLWVTRFYTRTDGLEARDRSAESPKTNVDKITEARDDSSMFAKRMDAPLHIMHQSENIKINSAQKKIICYFCGKSGHDFRKCPQLTDTELDDLLVKVGSFEGVDEESPCLCVRCFQFGHWAISCPSGNADMARNVIMDSSKRKIAPSSFVNAQNADEMCCAIRKLRLTRADILRWMNTNVSLLHLNGFFLRFRLRTLEAGLGETGYYVARITEDTVQDIYSDLKKSILVDVGGIKSSVGSEYVSNHDFLEDEIKAWWSRILKSGGKVPCLDELKSKAKDRTCLGF